MLPITGVVPHPEDFKGGKVDAARRSLDYMGLTPGTRLQDIAIDTVFIGSCTNGRIEDLREVAKVMEGRRVKDGLRAMIVPGSGLVRAQAEAEGIAQKLIEAGFDWRMAGCSMCLGDEPRPARARRALRLDLEPQLRGPPGPRRPHPPAQSRRWPRRRRSPAG